MANLQPNGRQQYFDNGGLPLVAGQLYTYDIGTTNPRVTYADEDQTEANPNPLILDSRGEVTVFWSGDYTVVLLDALGNQIWKVDGIDTNAAALFDNYAVDTGTANAYIVAGITASVASAGMKVAVLIQNTNTGPSTLAYSGIAAQPITMFGQPLLPGSVSAGVVYQFEYDGTSWQLLNGNIFGQSPEEVVAGVAPLYLQYEPGNVLRYGADRTGVTSAFNAFRSALKVACAASVTSGLGNHTRMYIPHGQYMIDQTNVFANPTGIEIRGLVIEGDGMGSSQIMLTTGGSSTIWCFLGDVSEASYISCEIRDLYITCDVAGGTTLANGFSWYQSQGWRFTNVYFNNLGTCWQDSGSSNGDSLKAVTCKATGILTRVFAMNNAQSLNNEFFGCDFESIFGNIFEVTSNGGGALRVYGGSMIMDVTAGDHFLLTIDGGSLGDNNNSFTFYGIQTELHTVNSKLLSIGPSGGQAPIVTFYSCNNTETNGARTSVAVAQGHVTFQNCVLTKNQGSNYAISGPANGSDQYGDPGSITFLNCEVPINLSTLILLSPSTDGFVWGYSKARDCFWSNFDSGVARTVRTAIDFDLNWQNQGRANNFMNLKRMNGKVLNRQWCDSTTAFDWTMTLPVNALVTKIVAYRAATATSTVYTLNVGNGDKSTTYATSGVSNTNAAQTVVYDQTATPATWINASNTSPGNQVRVWATTTATGQTAVGTIGYFYCEYL